MVTKKNKPKKKAATKKKVPAKKAVASKKSTPKKAAKKKIAKKLAPKKAAPKKAIAKKKGTAKSGVKSITDVTVTYVLTRIGPLEFDCVTIGYTDVDLQADKHADDPNKFSTQGDKTYDANRKEEGLKVVVRAGGKKGGRWSLAIKDDGNDLNDNPIKGAVDNMGHADHDEFHN